MADFFMQLIGTKLNDTQKDVFNKNGDQTKADLNQLATSGDNFSLATKDGSKGELSMDDAQKELQDGIAISVKGPDGKEVTVNSLAQLNQLTLGTMGGNQGGQGGQGAYAGMPVMGWPMGGMGGGFSPFMSNMPPPMF